MDNARVFITRLSKIVAAPYVALVVAVLLAYANVYGNAFLLDDLYLITNNKFLISWHYLGDLFASSHAQGGGVTSPFYRPLQSLLYLGVFQISGASTAAFHFLNVALHALNACLLFALGLRLGFHRSGAFFGALLWALHPAHTEAITFMSGTADPLCGAFLLLANLVLLPDFSARRILAASGFFVLALLSKETAIVFPALAASLLFLKSDARWSPKTYLKTWPFWLVAALYLALRLTVLSLDATPSSTDILHNRLATFLAVLPAYLNLLVWPHNLHLIEDVPTVQSFLASAALAGLVILALAAAVVFRKPRLPASPLAWGMLWAGVLLIPQSSLVISGQVAMMEHWLYLPSMALFLGAGESLVETAKPFRRVFAAAASCIALLFAFLTFEQNTVWRDGLTLFTHALESGADSGKLHDHLGIEYTDRGEYDLAIDHFRRALAFSDRDATAHYNLGVALINDALAAALSGFSAPTLTTPKVAEGLKHLERAVELEPTNPKSRATAIAVRKRFAP